MKKFLYFIMIFAAMIAAFTLASCGKTESNSDIVAEIPYVSDFACAYYESNGKKINDKTSFLNPEEILIKTNFTLLPEAYANGKSRFTVKFILSNGFEGKIVSANSSATSDKDLTATFTVDDKNSKNCEIEIRLKINYYTGNFKIAYAYDDEEYTEACKLPLNNDKTFSYVYYEDLDGYSIRRDPNNSEWFNRIYKINIPNSFAGKPVVEIDDYTFKDREFSYVEIPDSITRIGDYAFSGNSMLKEITIPNGVTEIGDYVFRDCIELTDVTMPSELIVSSDMFLNCDSLTTITILNSTVGWQAVIDVRSSSMHITLQNGVTEIGYDTFDGYRYFTSITIPNSVTSIGSLSFDGCSSLTDITIPNSVTSIGEAAFQACSSLTSITIPDGVTEIGDYQAFRGCKNLKSVTIPSSVTSIGGRAFYICSALKSVIIQKGVTSIGSYAFSSCSSLTSITIPDSVTRIGSYAFNGIGSSTSIYYKGDREGWRKIAANLGSESDRGTTIICNDGEIRFEFSFSVIG